MVRGCGAQLGSSGTALVPPHLLSFPPPDNCPCILINRPGILLSLRRACFILSLSVRHTEGALTDPVVLFVLKQFSVHCSVDLIRAKVWG